jgi:hypothetical protein
MYLLLPQPSQFVMHGRAHASALSGNHVSLDVFVLCLPPPVAQLLWHGVTRGCGGIPGQRRAPCDRRC